MDFKTRTKLLGRPGSPRPDPDGKGKASADRCLSRSGPPRRVTLEPVRPEAASERASERSAATRGTREPAPPLPPRTVASVRIRRHPPRSRRESGPRTSSAPGRAPETGVRRSRGPRRRGERGGRPDVLPATSRRRPCLSSSGRWATREALTASAAGPKPRGPRRWRRRWKRNSAPGLRLPPDLPRPRAPRPGASPAARCPRARAQLPARRPRERPSPECRPGRPGGARPLPPRARPLPGRRQWERSAGGRGRGMMPEPRPLRGSDAARGSVFSLRRGSLGLR